MTQLVSDADWAKFVKVVADSHDTFNKQTITWVRSDGSFNVDGEDENKNTSDVSLEVLLNYNHFRTWPITRTTETGELDRQSVVVLINVDYLRGLGYINVNNNFQFSADEDRFIIEGIKYKDYGFTKVSQAQTTVGVAEGLLIQLVLAREETETSDEIV